MTSADGLTPFQAAVFSLVQGVTELFPVSSLGHAVLMPRLLKWNLDQGGPGFLPYLVVMHFGTAVALLLYFWRDWWGFGSAIVFRRGSRAAAERALFGRLVVATIPAVVAALVLYNPIRALFGSPVVAASFLIVNGFVLFAAERLKRRRFTTKKLENLSWLDAVIIGVWQCLALIPGLSRSGSTMVGGLVQGLDHEDAARFSFLTGTPIILAATVHEAPKLMKLHEGFSSLALMSGALAGIAAFASTWVLMHWFQRQEFKALDPFAWWCWGFGALALALMLGHIR